jgi:DNA polymerase-3 subunit delta
VFELQDAISQKNLPKAIRIIQYFGANPKAGPVQLILPTLYNYFTKIYTAAAEANLSEATLKPLFYNNPFAVKQAIVAINNYGYSGTEKILLLLHEYNLRNIGINNGGSSDADLLKELAVKIIAE